jgi:DNA-binding response OmpR family regulator
MIKATVEGQLNGSLDLQWPSEGLRCSISIPLSDVETRERAPTVKESVARPNAKNILLVEDEPMVALMMADLLAEFGFLVVGPFGKLSEATAAAANEEIDGAILDINIKGKMVYPVADILAARGVPFLFVTGYASAGIETRFAQALLLQKPIEPEALRAGISGIIDAHKVAGAEAQ